MLFSSRVDDIALQKFKQCIMHRIMDRVSIFRSFLSWCGVLIIFDLFFLCVGVFFQGGPGFPYVLAV